MYKIIINKIIYLVKNKNPELVPNVILVFFVTSKIRKILTDAHTRCKYPQLLGERKKKESPLETLQCMPYTQVTYKVQTEARLAVKRHKSESKGTQ